MNSQKPPSGLVIYLYFLYFFKVRTGPNRPRRVTGGLNSPLGVPKKVPILGINYQRTNSPLDWHQFSIFLTTLRAVDDAFGITHLMTFWHTGR